MNFTTLLFLRNRSIFFKLSIVLVITAVISSVFAIGFMGRSIFRLSRSFIDKFTTASVERFIDDLGEQPTLERAKIISEKFGIEIRFESKDNTWATVADFPASNELHFRPWHKDRGRKKTFKRGFVRRKMYILIEKEASNYLFSPIYVFPSHTILFINITTVFIIILIFTAAYWMLRKILKPVQLLSDGVSKVSNGNLDIQLPVKNNDELGQLTKHFNQMITRIKEMLHAKERLLLDVSHELRSPLTRMKLAVEFIPESKSKSMISEDINALDIMLTELLESARLESNFGKLNFSNKNVYLVLQNVISGFKNQSAKIQLTSDHQEILANIDQMRLEIVFKNLINNAIKYNQNEKLIEIFVRQTAKSVVITVTDHGKGVPQSEQPFVFEPFYRVDKSRSKKTGGFGLGLSICKQIVEAHQGSIQIKSEEGKGTSMIVLLPI